jgi:hypothetical protein
MRHELIKMRHNVSQNGQVAQTMTEEALGIYFADLNP